MTSTYELARKTLFDEIVIKDQMLLRHKEEKAGSLLL